MTGMSIPYVGHEMSEVRSSEGWHWPLFQEVLCGAMTDRERMGLPKHYVKGRLDDEIQKATRALYGLNPASLLDRVKSERFSLAQRIAAGNYLALLGDPRIRTYAPELISVDGGTVVLGLSHDQIDEVMQRFDGLGLNRIWIEKECPQYTLTLQPYRIARYPVTNQEYRDFLLDTAYPEIPTSWTFHRFPQERSNHPVYTVTHQAADAYARWLQEKTKRAFRLPSEAEWEWAAMGGDCREFPWGNNFDADLANCCETGLFGTTPVGVFVGGVSPFGLHDMAGNVEEYVADEYMPYPNGTHVTDHLAEIHGAYRVARGGGFARFRDLLRTRRRHGQNPKSATYVMGFRLAESV